MLNLVLKLWNVIIGIYSRVQMKIRRDKKQTEVIENENVVTPENPVTLPVVAESFIETAKEVMEKHKNTLEKLVDNDYTESALGLKVEQDGSYSVVEFRYDPKNMAVSPDVITTRTGDSSKLVGIERLEIMLQNLIVRKHLYR